MLALGVIFGLGVPELILILVIVMIIFGVGRLPEIGGALGRSIRAFKKATREPDEIDVTAKPEAPRSADALKEKAEKPPHAT
jgi:sec-independent protein translocase protein TatA